MSSSSSSELRPLEDGRYERFLELFAEFMPPDAEAVYAEMGIRPEEVAALPRSVGELRQVEEDGRVAGYVWLELRERTLHVHALLLEPQSRGHGLGGRVLESLETELAGRIDEIELGVLPDNARALSVYQRAGFERVDERLGFFIMRKPVRATRE